MKLYNTLTRSVEPFTPLKPPAVTMYVCGPTVYDVPHLGHLRSAYVFDVLRRHLAKSYQEVTFVRNVTDVDDKIIERARQEPGSADLNTKCQQVAERYLGAYHDALKQLGITPPDHEPKATEHVRPDPENVKLTNKIDASMTGFISQLIKENVAYPSGGNVYFSVRKFSDYGKLSNQGLDELEFNARVEPREGKKDRLDFALWKASKPDEPAWDSPWGPGRPGWHIECSTMSTAYLGDAFDIHGGGLDLIFPHHENEIAQAQAAGKPFAKYWVHHGLLTVNGQKMSKSVGNYVTLDQVLKEYPHPDYLKLFFLKTHYRSPIDYSAEHMQEARSNWQEFNRFFEHYQKVAGHPSGGTDTDKMEIYRRKMAFEEALADDLNTPKALAVLFDLVNLGHRILESDAAMKLFMARWVRDVLIECGATFGLSLQGTSEVDQTSRNRIEKKISDRDVARKAKDFKKADAIRDELLMKERIILTDTAGGITLWRRAQ